MINKDDFINEDLSMVDSEEESVLDGMLAGDIGSDWTISSDDLSSDTEQASTSTCTGQPRKQKRAKPTSAPQQPKRYVSPVIFATKFIARKYSVS